jgi:hypothetical protein
VAHVAALPTVTLTPLPGKGEVSRMRSFSRVKRVISSARRIGNDEMALRPLYESCALPRYRFNQCGSEIFRLTLTGCGWLKEGHENEPISPPHRKNPKDRLLSGHRCRDRH